VSQTVHRPKARGLWSVVMAVICVAHLSGCGSDSVGTKSANVHVDRAAESKGIRNDRQGGAATEGIDQVFASAPSSEEPVTATMKLRPESLAAGEAAELLVSVRIATAHYVHAANKPGAPWVPLAMTVSLPDGVEFSGDWHLPTPDKGHGDAPVYRNSVLLRRALRVGAKSAPRDVRVSGKLRYQACNDELCWPTRTMELFAPLSIRDGAKWTHADELANLKVLYVGTERASDYVNFLTGKVARIDSMMQSKFKPQDAVPFDVVLLDWPQSQENREMRQLVSPLGARNDWNKPTVLLGSAGLNLAVAWKLKGGIGCTCLDPLAYDLRAHQIFERPFKIDRAKMISIGTPGDFKDEIRAPQIKVLPLVSNRDRHWNAGWCTYAADFEKYPDVEFYCGGVNHKTPTAAALWRQGNFLHFGFEQSPAEMNESGQRLLLNAIAYISRFSEDRPIAVTPSPFAGPVARNRKTLGRWLRNRENPVDFAKNLVTPQIWETLAAQGARENMVQWADANAKSLFPDHSQRLEIDEDLKAIAVAFDEPAFFDKTLADFRSGNAAVAARARRLLERYAPNGPTGAAGDAWTAWWKENQPFAFASDSGDYRWYIDPLAKKRGVPVSELRGPRRADLRFQSDTRN
jgi:hypothetical protein